MRRIPAIVALVSLICSMAPFVWAASCCSTGRVRMCHRGAGNAHHCDMMGGMEMGSQNAEQDANGAFSSLPDKCPMHCCMQSRSGTGTVVPSIVPSSKLTVTSFRVDFPALIFISNGFSSHTDRGPPQA